MNKHTKLALFIAPVLIILGYILSDMYIEHKAHEDKVVVLTTENSCDVLNKSCILSSDDLQLSIYDENGITFINSTFALDKATLFLVNSNGSTTEYNLEQDNNPFYWKVATNLNHLIAKSGERYKLRVIAQIKGGKYINEFYTQTQ